jgi:hypothetical protein
MCKHFLETGTCPLS